MPPTILTSSPIRSVSLDTTRRPLTRCANAGELEVTPAIRSFTDWNYPPGGTDSGESGWADCYSGSAMEWGENAGAFTFGNAKQDATTLFAHLDKENLQAALDHFAEYGAWDADEMATWTRRDLLAMILQEVAAEWREIEGIASELGIETTVGDQTRQERRHWFRAWRDAAESGHISSRLWSEYSGAGFLRGRWFVHLGN